MGLQMHLLVASLLKQWFITGSHSHFSSRTHSHSHNHSYTFTLALSFTHSRTLTLIYSRTPHSHNRTLVQDTLEHTYTRTTVIAPTRTHSTRHTSSSYTFTLRYCLTLQHTVYYLYLYSHRHLIILSDTSILTSGQSGVQ